MKCSIEIHLPKVGTGPGTNSRFCKHLGVNDVMNSSVISDGDHWYQEKAVTSLNHQKAKQSGNRVHLLMKT